MSVIIRKLTLISSLTWLLTGAVFAQGVNEGLGDIQMPSPQAASLGKFVDIPVGTFTGVPATDVPIYNIQDGPLSHNISLKYHASGIRVAEVASWTGLGWSLQAGGMISRTVMGLPDEKPEDGYLSNAHDYEDPFVVHQVANGRADGEPDLFTFNVGGLSGKFIINGAITNIIQYPTSDVKVEIVDNSLKEFKLTGPDGTVYRFGAATQDSPYHGFLETGGLVSGRPPTKQRIEWYLRRIESYDGQFAIDFTYRSEKYSIMSPSSTRRTRTKGVDILNASTIGNDCNLSDYSIWQLQNPLNYLSNCLLGWQVSMQSSPGGDYDYYGSTLLEQASNSHAAIYGNLQRFTTSKIDQITSSLTTIKFIPSANGREDVDAYSYDNSEIAHHAPVGALAAIEIRPTTGLYFCKRFDLRYSYWTSDSDPVYTYQKRLRLNSVSESSGCAGTSADVSIPRYSFKYYGDEVYDDGPTTQLPFFPSRFDKAVDEWGYYNGKASNNQLNHNIPSTKLAISFGNDNLIQTYGEAQRATSPNHMLTGTLRSVTYPTGGRTDFGLESNAIPAVYYTKWQNPTSPFPVRWPNMETCDYDQATYSTCCSSSSSTLSSTQTFNLTQDMYERGGWKIYLKDLGCVDDEHRSYVRSIARIFIRKPGVSGWATDQFEFETIFDRPFDSADSDETTTIIDIKSLFDPAKGFNFVPGQYEIIFEAFAGAAKMDYQQRNKVNYNKNVGGLRVKQLSSYNYDSTLVLSKSYSYSDTLNDLSSGTLYREPSFGYNVVSIGTSSSRDFKYFSQVWESSPILPLTDINGYHIGYRQVQEHQADGGVTLYTHTVHENKGLNTSAFPRPPDDYIYDNGNITGRYLINAASDTISYTLTDYYTLPPLEINGYSSLRAINAPGGNGVIFATLFSHKTGGYTRPVTKVEAIDGVGQTTNLVYTTRSHYLPTVIVTTHDDGTVVRQEREYAREFRMAQRGTVYAKMEREFNLNSIPLEVRTYVDGNRIKGMRTEFDLLSVDTTEIPYPKRLLELKATVDETGQLVETGTEAGFEVVGTFNDYEEGNLVSFTRSGGWLPETYSWLSGGRLQSRTYGNLTWSMTYHPSTRLVHTATQPDGLFSEYKYDPLARLKSSSKHNGKVKHIYNYAYRNSGSTEHNYTQVTEQYEAVEGSQLTTLHSYTYLDGIGRNWQAVRENSVSDTGDVVIATVEYDLVGRPIRKYEPFASSSSEGGAVTDYAGYPFIETTYYADPLSRTKTVTLPEWPIPTQYYYGSNDEVLGTAEGRLFDPHTLRFEDIESGNGEVTRQYYDGRGRMVVHRTFSGLDLQTALSTTQNVYDVKDRLFKVYPPGTTDAAGLALNEGQGDEDIQQLIYTYLYDGSDNLK